jgi:hypothetical protein
VLREALAAARTYDGFSRSHALTALIPHLAGAQKDEVLCEAFAAAKAVGGHGVGVLVGLVPYLGPMQLGEALAIGKSDGFEYSPQMLLASLASRLTPELLHEALAAAKAIRHERFRYEALATLAPHLAPELLCEAITAARGIGDDDIRAMAVGALSCQLAPEQLGEAFSVIQAIRDQDESTKALGGLIGRVTGTLKGAVLLAMIDAVGDASRSSALAAVESSAGPTYELGGQEAVIDLCRAIKDVCNWYP